MVAKADAGAKPVPYKNLTADVLADSIKKLLTPECQKAAKKMADQIAGEGDGAENAVNSFHRALPLRGNHSMRCSILEEDVAVWWLKRSHVRLSALAAEILVIKGKLRWSDLHLIRHYDWNDLEGPGEPLTGLGGAIISSVASAARGIGGTPQRWASTIRREKNKNKQRQSKGSDRALKDSEGLDTKSKAKSEGHDEKSGTTKRGKLPAANLGEGRLKKEISKNKAKGQRLSPIPSDTPDASSKDAAEPDSLDQDPGTLDPAKIASSLAQGTGQGFAETGKAIARAPVNISLALAQGFHNAPRLWGDDTVRTPRRVTGIKSGLRAAREGFVYGVSDGISGLVRQPYHGAKEEGALGAIKGVGKGVGGFILKDLAALAGLPAYTLKGIQKEIGKGNQPTSIIRRAHIIEGQRRLTLLSEDERRSVEAEVAKGWRIIVAALAKKNELEKKGLTGHLHLRKTRKQWKKNAVFENVDQINQALAVEEQGRDLDTEFKRHRRAVDKASETQRSRSSVAHKDQHNSVAQSRHRRKSKTLTKQQDAKSKSAALNLEEASEKKDADAGKVGVKSTDFESAKAPQKDSSGLQPGSEDNHPSKKNNIEPDAEAGREHRPAESESGPHTADVSKPSADGQTTALPPKREILRHVLTT